MAAVTGAVIGGVSALGGAYQAIQGAKQARDAQNALNNLPIPELQNVYAGMQVSKLGNQLVSEQSQNRFATNVDALRSGGIRGIIGGLGDVNAQSKQTDLQIKADYDKQENDIAMSQAQDEASIRAMKEARYQGNVSALSSQVTAGRASEMQGLHGIAQGITSGAQMYNQQNQYDQWLASQSPKGKQVQGLQPMGTNTQIVNGLTTSTQLPSQYSYDPNYFSNYLNQPK